MSKISYAKRLLESYACNKAAEDNYRWEMTMINSRLYSSPNERTMVEMIEAKDRLALRTDKAVREARETEAALKTLTPYQQELLSAFYIARVHSGAENLAGRYNVERSTVYRDKNKALNRFASALSQ